MWKVGDEVFVLPIREFGEVSSVQGRWIFVTFKDGHEDRYLEKDLQLVE